jgi:hypothetical protein
MAGNWPISKDELYGPPPAYSLTNNYENPPSYTPTIYVVPLREIDYQDRSASHASIILSNKFTRYLLGSGLVHMVVGLAAIVSDVILTIMNESYSFTGLWTGALSIILGIYLILYMTQPEKRICSLRRLQYFHLTLGVISIIALILSSLNLASDSCYKIYLGPDRCQHSAYLIKIVLVTIFSFIIVQVSVTIGMTCTQTKQSRLEVTRNNERTPEFIS